MKLHPYAPCALAALLYCATCCHAQAQSSAAGRPMALATLPTVVVSGTRSERPRDELPLTLDAVDARELEDAQTGDIHDLAKSLPNVDVKRAPDRFTVTGAGNPTGRDGNASFNMRGLDGNRVLMLSDGVRLPRSYINGNNAFGRDSLTLDLLQRVELLYGPSSVLYGSDGLAGLVNFITYEPADLLHAPAGQRKELGGKISLRYSGDDSGTSLSTLVAGRAGTASQWLLGASTRHASGLDNRGSNDAANVDRTRPNPQADTGRSVLGKWVFQPGDGQKHVLTLEHIQKNSDVELLSSRAKPALIASSVLREHVTQQQLRERLSWDAHLRLTQDWADGLHTHLSRQVSNAQDDGSTWRNDGGVRLRLTSYAQRSSQASVQFDKALTSPNGWSQKITYGVDWASTDVTTWFGGSDPAPLPAYVPKKYFPDTRDSSWAAFAQDEVSYSQWHITPGLRWERYALDVLRQDGFAPPSPTPGKSLQSSHVSPKLGLLYRLSPQWSLLGNYASGFKTPDAAQLNGFTENPTPTTYVLLLSNPNLKPETSRNLELGLRARMERVRLDATAFYGRYSQLIVDKKPLGGLGTAASPLLFQSVNVNSATLQGFELRAALDLGDGAGGNWSSPLAYGQTRGTDRSTGLPLNGVNPSKLMLGLKYEAPRWDLALQATHHGAKTSADLDSPYLPKPATPPRVPQFTVPAVTTLDLQAQFRLSPAWRLHGGVGNLTNQKYWLWSDVQGLAATSAVVDAYTQPGRNVRLSLVGEF